LGYTVPGRMSTFVGTLEKWCLLLRVQFRVIQSARDDTAHCPPVVLVVAVRAWVDVGRAQAQVVGVVGRVRRRRPEAAIRATIVHRTTVDGAGIDEVVRIASKLVCYWTGFSCTSVIWRCAAIIVSWIGTAI